MHRAAHTALKGFLFLPQALDALTGKVHLGAINVAHTADALVVRPRDRRIGVRSALPCTAQVQYFPQASDASRAWSASLFSRSRLPPR